MGDGVTGSTNAPANQPTHAGRSGDSSQADTAAKAKFGDTLNQENLCPPGLTRKPPENCSYLRPPGQPSQPEKPIDIKVHNDPGSSKGPMNRTDGPDVSKPIPKLPDNSLKPPEGPYHTGGLGRGDGAHIGGWEWKI